MSAIVPFLFESEHLVRTVERGGDPWVVLADVCRVLGISNSRDAASRLDDDEKATLTRCANTDSIDGCDADARAQTITVINESGLYALIFRSRKPVAKRFRKWVTGEVLPAIRKTGGYGTHRPIANEATRNEAFRLMKAITRETDPAVRRAMHATLQDLAPRVGVQVPALAELGRDAPPAADLSGAFWSGVTALEMRGISVNHSRDPGLIAVNLPELARHGLPTPIIVRRALKLCEAPRFVGIRTVRSAHAGRPLKCWLFDRKAG